MAEITAGMVKTLREQTGAGMMDCKKALAEAAGDMAAAQEILRKKVGAKVEKKAGRQTSEGLVAIAQAPDGKSATMVEVLCETDFCARNDEFKAMVAEMLSAAEAQGEGATDLTADMKEKVDATLAKIGENMSFSRGVKIAAPCVGSYLHHNNKVGVLVGVDKEVPSETLSELCMHIAFSDPMGISPDDIPADLVEKEKQYAMQEAIDSGKPAEIAEKMVEGKIRKFLAANALMEQPFVKDEKKAVKEVLGGATVTAFARFAIGG